MSRRAQVEHMRIRMFWSKSAKSTIFLKKYGNHKNHELYIKIYLQACKNQHSHIWNEKVVAVHVQLQVMSRL